MTAPLSICGLCGLPRERIVKRVAYDDGQGPRRIGKYRSADGLDPDEAVAKSGRQDVGRTYVPRKPVTTGWSTCACAALTNWTAGTVLDPFAGTSSTGYSALLLGRNYIGIDLYREHCRMSSERCLAAIDLLRKKGLIRARPSELRSCPVHVAEKETRQDKTGGGKLFGATTDFLGDRPRPTRCGRRGD